MRKVCFVVLCILLSACAVDYSKFAIYDTRITGDEAALAGYYGVYDVVDAKNHSNRIGYIEILPSNENKPVFRFFDKKGDLLGGFSKRECDVSNRRIKCGKGDFLSIDLPHIAIYLSKDGENYPPPPKKSFIDRLREPSVGMAIVPGGYQMIFKWDHGDRYQYISLKKRG